ncbi:hypothetical protein ACJ5NV_01390 [Loktanella agnita]|uniref:hypothetical protein n=1 Tax=Loktanella agnita TaxID=287097 RepID=UPI0039870EF9
MDTGVKTLDFVEHLSALQSFNLSHTGITDLSFLLQLPHFAGLTAQFLSFFDTPLAREDRRWEMLSGLSPEVAAKDVILYLRGEHPDLQPPAEGAQVATGAAGMLATSPVQLEERDGKAEIVDAEIFHPPVPMDGGKGQDTLEGLHVTADNLLSELQHGVNVSPRLLRRVERYAIAAHPSGTPSFALLEGAMVLLRPLVTDPYTREPLDPGLIAGLEQLVTLHDSFGGPSATPDPLPVLPHQPDTPDQTAQATETIEKLAETIKDATQAGFVGNTVVFAINSTVEASNAAAAPLHRDAPAEEVEQRKGFWSWALRMSGGLAKGLEQYIKTHRLIASPEVQALLMRLTELISSLAPYFNV